MTSTSSYARIASPLLALSVVLAGVGCGTPKTLPPVEAPTFTSALIAPPAAPIVTVSPNVNVSDEIANACKLRFDDIESTPKFGFDQSSLGSQDQEVLARLATCLTSGPLAGRGLQLVGRADSRGPTEYNMALGERRASTVHMYLTTLGVESARMIDGSRGELDATGTDEAGWMRDRRVDIVLR